MGVGQSGEAGTHGLASPHTRGAHVTQVNGNSLLQRKRLKKKRQLQGLTAHGTPLLLPMGEAPVARAFVYPGRGALPGGGRFWGGGRGGDAGDCFGSRFFRGQGTQTILKNKRKSQRSQGSLLRGVHRAHQSCSAHCPLPSRDSGHKWLTAAPEPVGRADCLHSAQ